MKRLRYTIDYDSDSVRDLLERPVKDKIISFRHREIKQSARFAKQSKKQYV